MRKVKIEIIPNEKGYRTNPSMVCFKSNDILIGTSAKYNM